MAKPGPDIGKETEFEKLNHILRNGSLKIEAVLRLMNKAIKNYKEKV